MPSRVPSICPSLCELDFTLIYLLLLNQRFSNFEIRITCRVLQSIDHWMLPIFFPFFKKIIYLFVFPASLRYNWQMKLLDIWTIHLGGGSIAKSCPTLATPWTIACQAPLSMGFSRQEYWSGLPSPSPGDLPDPGIETGSSALQADALPTELQGKSLKYTSWNLI